MPTDSLPRRSFIALLAALPGLRLIAAQPVSTTPYVPSFLHPNDHWVVLRNDSGFGLTVMNLETGREVQRIDFNQWGTYYGDGGLYFDPSGRYLVMAWNGKWLSYIVRFDLEKPGKELAFAWDKRQTDTEAVLNSFFSEDPDCPPFRLPEPGGILRFADSDWTLSSFRLIRRRAVPLRGSFIQKPFGPLWTRSAAGRFWEILKDPMVRWARIRCRSGKPDGMVVTRHPDIWQYGESGGANSVRIAARRTHDSILVWSGYSTVREYDATSMELIRCVSGTMPQTGLLAFDKDRFHLFAARPLGTAVAWNRKGQPSRPAGSTKFAIEKPPLHEMGLPLGKSRVGWPQFAQGCRALAAGTTLIALGLDDGKVLLGERKEMHGGPWVTLGEHPAAVRAMAFSSDETTLLTGARDGSLRLWDIPERRERMTFPKHVSRINACAIVGFLAITGGPDGIHLWDLRDGTPQGSLDTEGVWVSDVTWSPDGTKVAGAMMDGSLRVWDVEKRELLWRANAQKGWCAAAAFHPTEPWIAAGYERGTIRIWDVGNGQSIREATVEALTVWQAGTLPIHALAWSPDGMALAAAFGDAVRVYDRSLKGSGGPGWILPLDWADDYT